MSFLPLVASQRHTVQPCYAGVRASDVRRPTSVNIPEHFLTPTHTSNQASFSFLCLTSLLLDTRSDVSLATPNAPMNIPESFLTRSHTSNHASFSFFCLTSLLLDTRSDVSLAAPDAFTNEIGLSERLLAGYTPQIHASHRRPDHHASFLVCYVSRLLPDTSRYDPKVRSQCWTCVQ